jgi:hypothetical protein
MASPAIADPPEPCPTDQPDCEAGKPNGPAPLPEVDGGRRRRQQSVTATSPPLPTVQFGKQRRAYGQQPAYPTRAHGPPPAHYPQYPPPAGYQQQHAPYGQQRTAFQQPGEFGPPPPEQAAEESEPSPPFFDMALGTQFPLALGPQLTLEIPWRFLLQAEVGWMPAAYASTVAAMIVEFGKDDNVIAAVVDNTLSDSLVVRASLGWRPFPSAGFELGVGYTGIRVDGEVEPGAVAALFDDVLEDEVEQLDGNLPVSSQLHNIHVGIGWRFLALEDHLVIRVQLGYMQTLGASSSIDIPGQPELERRVRPVFDEELETLVRNDLKLPVIGVNLGYRF